MTELYKYKEPFTGKMDYYTITGKGYGDGEGIGSGSGRGYGDGKDYSREGRPDFLHEKRFHCVLIEFWK